jgi:hypothetical protein
MKIGYGRVSTRDQNPDAQHDALAAAGCDQVFIEKASGKLAGDPVTEYGDGGHDACIPALPGSRHRLARFRPCAAFPALGRRRTAFLTGVCG